MKTYQVTLSVNRTFIVQSETEQDAEDAGFEMLEGEDVGLDGEWVVSGVEEVDDITYQVNLAVYRTFAVQSETEKDAEDAAFELLESEAVGMNGEWVVSGNQESASPSCPRF